MNRLRWRNLIGVIALVLAAGLALAAPAGPSSSENDEQALRQAGLGTDGPALLALLEQHTLTASRRKNVDGLIVRLGAESFAEREKATKELFAIGRLALTPLRQARTHRDPEVARRARALIERIEQTPAQPLPLAALHLLAIRKPAGAVEALLAYLPDAEDETRAQETRKALIALAQREGKLDPALLRALTADSLLVRAAALEALAAGGGAEGCAAVRKYLHDKMPQVRLHTALALARAREREAVPALIDLLDVLPDEKTGEIEEFLYQLAGDSAPELPRRADAAARTKYRDAWAAWWKVNGAHVDLQRLAGPPVLGFTLICDNERNRVFEIDRHGRERWAIENILNPLDAWVLSGSRVLIAESNGNRVSERDFKGRILWQKLIADPVSVQRLPSGNTFLSTYKGRVLEVDRNGKESYSISRVRGRILASYQLPDGVIVYQTTEGECVLVNRTGKLLNYFATKHPTTYANALDLSPDGRILVAEDRRGQVVEYDREGRVLRKLAAPGVTTASWTPNGHILATSKTARRVYELDGRGRIVWEYKAGSPIFRARRR